MSRNRSSHGAGRTDFHVWHDVRSVQAARRRVLLGLPGECRVAGARPEASP